METKLQCCHGSLRHPTLLFDIFVGSSAAEPDERDGTLNPISYVKMKALSFFIFSRE